MSALFTEKIDGWGSWSAVFHSAEAFAPLAEAVFARHGLPFSPLTELAPGTNAVFRSGGYVVKLFAPREAMEGLFPEEDMRVELCGMERAASLGASVPRVRASGVIDDSYSFPYIIMDFVGGVSLGDAAASMSARDKVRVGTCLRELTDAMDTPCEHARVNTPGRGADSFPQSFRDEREMYLRENTRRELVFVHGDLNPDNVMLDGDDVTLLDFADSCAAPFTLELAGVVCELFRFDRDFLAGYFGGNYDADAVARDCTDGLLRHPFCENIVRDRFGDCGRFGTVDSLYSRLREAVAAGVMMK